MEELKISNVLQDKDKLIQQFSHTLRSLLGPAREFIRTAIKTGNTDRLKNVLSDLESVDKNLELLSLSARDPQKLKERITESLAESGYGLSEILFSSMVSSLSLVLNNHEYEGHVLSRYLAGVSGTQSAHLDGFSQLRDGDRKALLEEWKERQDWDDETSVGRMIKRLKCNLGDSRLTKRGNASFQAYLDKTMIALHILLRS